MDSVAGKVQKYSGSVSVSAAVQSGTGMPTDLARLVGKYVDYSPVFAELILNDSGMVLDCEHNKEIVDALAAALEDPDCPQQVSEYINKTYHQSQLRQLMGAERAKSDASLIEVEVDMTTDLGTELSSLTRQFIDYSPALDIPELNQSGEVIESAENRLILDTGDAALSDPDSPRAVINALFRNVPRSALNQLMARKLEKGEVINLDRTDLYHPDFTGLVLSEQFSASHAEFYRPRFTNTTLAGNLNYLDVWEPFCKGMVVSDKALLDGANLLDNYLGEA